MGAQAGRRSSRDRTRRHARADRLDDGALVDIGFDGSHRVIAALADGFAQATLHGEWIYFVSYQKTPEGQIESQALRRVALQGGPIEEPSMEEALRAILPKILGDMSFAIYTHRCKDDLLARLPQRLTGYSKFLPSSGRVVVIVDRDDQDCKQLKTELEHVAMRSKLKRRHGLVVRNGKSSTALSSRSSKHGISVIGLR